MISEVNGQKGGPVQQAPSSQPPAKVSITQGRTWTQKFETIKAALVRIFSFKIFSSKTDVKANSIKIIEEEAKDLKANLEADKAKENIQPKMEERPGQQLQETETSDNQKEAAQPALLKTMSPKLRAKQRVDELSKSMGEKTGKAVGGAVETMAHAIGTFAVNAIAMPHTIASSLGKSHSSFQVPAAATSADNPAVFASLQPIKELRATERTHLAAVERDQEILVALLDPIKLKEVKKKLPEDDIRNIQKFSEDFTAYAEMTKHFHQELEKVLSELDQDTVDLAKIAKDLKKVFFSEYERLHQASEKVLDHGKAMNAIVKKNYVQQFANQASKKLFQFEPQAHPFQRMTRYPMLLKEIKNRFTRLDDLPPEIQKDLADAQRIIEQSVVRTNAGKQAEEVKKYQANPKDLRNPFNLRDFRKLIRALGLYKENPTTGKFLTSEEAKQAVKLDVSYTKKAIPKLLKEAKKTPAKLKELEAELKDLRFALDHYYNADHRETKKLQGQADEWQRQLETLKKS